MIRILSASVLLILLSSCAEMSANMRDYVEPASGDTSKIRFSTNGEISIIPGRSCLDWSAPNAGIVVTDLMYLGGAPKLIGQKIGMKGTAPAGYKSAEVKVPGGQPVTVSFSSTKSDGGYVYTCKGAFTFLPKVSEEYQMTVWHDEKASLCRYEPTLIDYPEQRVPIYRANACK